MIKIDLARSKDIAHDIRRRRRAEAFAPLDDAIAKQIPGVDLESLEIQRQAIRDADEKLQNQIDSAESIQELSELIK
jgi:hypothetical protein